MSSPRQACDDSHPSHITHENPRILFLHYWGRGKAEQAAGLLAGRFLDRELTRALAEVKELTGLFPICSYCKKIRDAEDSWHPLETYVANHSHAQFSYGICPECLDQTARPTVEKLLAANKSQTGNAQNTAAS